MPDLKSLCTRWFTEVWNHKNAAVIDELGHPHMTGHGLLPDNEPEVGINRFKKFHTQTLTTFPDLHVTLHHCIAEDDYAACRISFTGTHTGPGMGTPTNKRFTLSALTLIRFQNQKIIEAWNEYDRASMLQQLSTQ